jgi:hypothetical protein
MIVGWAPAASGVSAMKTAHYNGREGSPFSGSPPPIPPPTKPLRRDEHTSNVIQRGRGPRQAPSSTSSRAIIVGARNRRPGKKERPRDTGISCERLAYGNRSLGVRTLGEFSPPRLLASLQNSLTTVISTLGK